jgi:hypothetical protein
VQDREADAHDGQRTCGTSVADASSVTEDSYMLMFKRSQIYVGLGLAAVVELIIRVVAH